MAIINIDEMKRKIKERLLYLDKKISKDVATREILSLNQEAEESEYFFLEDLFKKVISGNSRGTDIANTINTNKIKNLKDWIDNRTDRIRDKIGMFAYTGHSTHELKFNQGLLAAYQSIYVLMEFDEKEAEFDGAIEYNGDE